MLLHIVAFAVVAFGARYVQHLKGCESFEHARWQVGEIVPIESPGEDRRTP